MVANSDFYFKQVREVQRLMKVVEQYHEALSDEMRCPVPPSFRIGQKVRVRKDAESLHATCWDEDRSGNVTYTYTNLYSGFDEIRQEKRGHIGKVLSIDYTPIKSTPKYSNITYMVFFKRGGDHKTIRFSQEHLESYDEKSRRKTFFK